MRRSAEQTFVGSSIVDGTEGALFLRAAARGRCSLTKETAVSIFDKLSGKKDEKPKADFSNVQSGSSSTAAQPAPPAPIPTPASTVGTMGTDQTYTVVSGDSLSKIAKRYYGDANQWHRIHEANRDQIKNPDLIHPGQKLRIPGA
jgi:nucleoid-associated protein YgaU